MSGRPILELAAATTDLDGALALAERLGGTAYCDHRERWSHLPFRALVTVVTDEPDGVTALGDVGTYVVCRRLKKPGDSGAVALFPLVRRSDLGHQAADAHWRDVHGPLALTHHGHMTHYTQLSVVANLGGLPLDGFALVGFRSEDDVRERFYSRPDSEAVIAADVAKFADLKRSPRRLLTVEHRFGAD